MGAKAIKGLTKQRKAFVEYYVELGNQAQAYLRAFPRAKNGNVASVEACKLLKIPRVAEYYEKLLEQASEKRIAKAYEVLEYLTRVMKGEELDQFGLEAALSDRTKAAELLGKRYGLFKEKVEVSGSVGITDVIRKARERAKNGTEKQG